MTVPEKSKKRQPKRLANRRRSCSSLPRHADERDNEQDELNEDLDDIAIDWDAARRDPRALLLLCDDRELSIRVDPGSFHTTLLSRLHHIQEADTAVLDLSKLTEWTETEVRFLVSDLVTFNPQLEFKCRDVTSQHLRTVLKQLLETAKTQDQKLAIISGVKETYRSDIGDASLLAIAVDSLRTLHAAAGLPVPSKPELKKELRQRANPTGGTPESGPLLPSDIPTEIFLGRCVHADLIAPPGYRVDEFGVTFQSVVICDTPVIINAILLEPDRHKEHFEVFIRRGGQTQTFMAPASEILSRHTIHRFADFGLDASTENASELVKYLQAFRNDNDAVLPRRQFTPQMGYLEITPAPGGGTKSCEVFLSGREVLISSRDKTELENAGPGVTIAPPDAGESEYVRHFHPRGKLEKWKATLVELHAFPAAFLAVIAAFCAPLLRILDHQGFVVSLAGLSSTGKTSLLRLIASVFGKPEIGDGVILDFRATANALERLLVVSDDHPVCVDETQLAQDPELLEGLIFQTASGKLKSRATLKGAQANHTFRVVLFLIGEASAVDQCNAQGAAGRVLELRGCPFESVSTATAEVIQKFVRTAKKNYGLAGRKFVRYLLRRRKAWPRFQKRYDELVSEERKQVPIGSGLAVRQADLLALVRLAAELLVQALKLPNELRDPVSRMRAQIYEAITEEDKFTKARNSVLSYARETAQKFHDAHTTTAGDKRDGCEGWVDDRGRGCVFFLEPVLERILWERCQLRLDAVLREFGRRGWLERGGESPRPRIRRKLGGRNETVIGILRPRSDDDQSGDDEAAWNPAPGAAHTETRSSTAVKTKTTSADRKKTKSKSSRN